MGKLINQLIGEAIEEATETASWPASYVNRTTRKTFRKPEDSEVRKYLYSDTPKYLLFKAPEGAGKTTLGSIKTLDKLRRGMDGALMCPDYPYLTRIIKEFWRWIPWDMVIEKHRHMGEMGWTPYKGNFELTVKNEIGGYSTLILGGVSTNFSKWESLNLNFVWLEEARSIQSSEVMDVLTGRMRVKGPKGEPPQLYITSTPTSKGHWLYEYFGPEKPPEEEDPKRDFKQTATVVSVPLENNLDNLSEDYVKDRAAALSKNEQRMRLKGEWGEVDADNPFLPDMALWRKLYDPKLAPLRKKDDPDRDWSDALVLGVDGAVSGDHFAIVGVTRHPNNRDELAVRLVKVWKPKGEILDFKKQEDYLKEICDEYNVLVIVYDQYQLHHMMTNLSREGYAWTKVFSQNAPRSISDQQLFNIIIQEKIHHMNQEDLNKHMANADTIIKDDDHKRRIVKRQDSLKIDSVIGLSMASSECLRLNI